MPGLEWVVSSVVRFSGNGPVFMSRLAASTQAANAQFLRQQGLITKADAALMAYQRRMESVRMQQLKMTQKVSGGIALGGAFALGYSIAEAAKLERAMTGVQIATSATADQYAKLRGMAIAVSGFTAQSAVTIANEMAMAAQVAFHDPKQLEALFPMMAKYADVRYMSPTHDDPVHSIERMSQFSHFFGAYTPEKMKPLLDDTAKLQYTTAASLTQLVTQGKYFIPIATQMGVSMDTIFQYLAIMGQLGALSGRGGTSVKNLQLGAMSVTPTAHMSAAKSNALNDLHLRDKSGTFKFLTKNGDLDLVGMISYLRDMGNQFNKANKRTGKGRMSTDLGAIWGQSALPLLEALIAKTTEEQMGRNKQAFKKIPGVDGQWELYSKDLFYQFNAFVTNMKNLAMAIGTPMLPAATTFFKGLADNIGGLVTFLGAHPNAGALVSSLVAGLTVAAGITFTGTSIAMFVSAAKALSLLSTAGAAGGATTAATGLSGIAAALTLPVWATLAVMAGGMVAIGMFFQTPAWQALQNAANWAADHVSGGPSKITPAAAKAAINAMGGEAYWEAQGNKYGWNTLPSDVRGNMHVLHDQEGKNSASVVHIGSISLPGVKTWQEVEAFMRSLKDPRSPQAAQPSKAGTSAFQAPVLQLGLGYR